MKTHARSKARELTTAQLARDIEHARNLWGCTRDERYATHYARVIGIFRAALCVRQRVEGAVS